MELGNHVRVCRENGGVFGQDIGRVGVLAIVLAVQDLFFRVLSLQILGSGWIR